MMAISPPATSPWSSSRGRPCGLDILVGTYNVLDLVPTGRDEAALPWAMAWVRHHDRHGDEGAA
jgi:predicted dithiol-disulfide oxidoreductase (DUF899 family)